MIHLNQIERINRHLTQQYFKNKAKLGLKMQTLTILLQKSLTLDRGREFSRELQKNKRINTPQQKK